MVKFFKKNNILDFLTIKIMARLKKTNRKQPAKFLSTLVLIQRNYNQILIYLQNYKVL